MQKRNFFKSPFGIAALVCFAIAFVSPFIFVNAQSQYKQEVTKKESPTATASPLQVEENDQSVQGQTTYNQTATPTHPASSDNAQDKSSGQVSNSTSNTNVTTATSTPAPTSAPVKQTFHVSLKVNGSSAGNVDMEEGNNQCDVLSRAKDQGKLSQLLMKYDNSLGTNGVYQINGVGKENVVWWVYKVNGQSPTQGCSHVKANSGDTVEWEYKG